MRTSTKTLPLLFLLAAAIQPAFASPRCPPGHECCPPDQQLPCDHNTKPDTGTPTLQH